VTIIHVNKTKTVIEVGSINFKAKLVLVLFNFPVVNVKIIIIIKVIIKIIINIAVKACQYCYLLLWSRQTLVEIVQ